MKTLLRWTLMLAAAAAAGWVVAAAAQDEFDGDWSGGRQYQSVLAINADSSCVVTIIVVQPRTEVEQRLRMMERYEDMQEAAEDSSGEAKPAVSATNNVAAYTDEQLAAKLTENFNDRDNGSGGKFAVRVEKDSVVTVTTNTYPTLEEMLRERYPIWTTGGLMFEDARFETDSNGLLRVTLMPQKNMGRYFKTYRSALKMSGAKSQLKLVFPGRVVASGFTNTQGNATWMDVDGSKDETLDALQNFYTAPTVIVAEAGGIKLNQPLDAKSLWRTRRFRQASDEDLPLTDAGPGFVAEAQSLTTTTLQIFPGGEKYYERNVVTTGAVVTIKLFAPKGRTLESVSDVRVVSAVDDKGRSIVPDTGNEDEDMAGNRRYGGGGSPDTSSTQLELGLQLPKSDAHAIDKVSATAVAVTVGSWKEMPVTNLQANATNAIDLSPVLPGATMTITKVSSKNHQFNLVATLTGPATVKRLDVKAKFPGAQQFNSNCNERKTSTTEGRTTRVIQVQAYGFGEPDTGALGNIMAVVRYPEDLKRERVKFDLNALDLF
jgi:hypothetical protein